MNSKDIRELEAARLESKIRKDVEREHSELFFRVEGRDVYLEKHTGSGIDLMLLASSIISLIAKIEKDDPEMVALTIAHVGKEFVNPLHTWKALDKKTIEVSIDDAAAEKLIKEIFGDD